MCGERTAKAMRSRSAARDYAGGVKCFCNPAQHAW